ncbi:helix-turn-helix transcriptional regulator [Bacillus sp. FJAT-50079]|uniref:helix-turn-helix domain-containing protein n=1 Tax=Bacillus sp. FJAT-50079 TaxID=2833577 RepID=UPI001BC8D0D6|nr:helix-turn-helix transcriptional regulator [Bacillus sp. FJAT-50079]MBS4206766.1 helix-turn-helix transcriptional regulator [Bacillus sp. FJAT-50079]
MSFYKKLREYRSDVLHLSQEEASQRLHITQPALSQYESGKRQIPTEALPHFQKAYSIPPDYFLNMLLGSDYGEDYTPMMLREHSHNTEMQRIIDMLNRHESLFKFLSSLTYSDEKTQENLAELLPHLKKFIQNK